ncbi:30033_t:CDS:2, partial [Racocetra persica]
DQSEFTDKNSNDASFNEENPIPVVLVEGFMGPSKPSYWDKNEKKQYPKTRRCIFVTPGCGSSLHDRAVEIFYQIKGGRVDYGKDHALKYGHSRYGRECPGLYPEWSVSKPLHFLGHSFGGVTIWKLQQLLASDLFPAYHEPHPDMVRSLTAISSPFKGSHAVCIVGRCTEDVRSIRPISFGALIGRMIHIHEYFDIKWIKKLTYDFNCDQWNLSFKKNFQSMWDEYFGDKYISGDSECQNSEKEKTYGLLQFLFKSPWMYCEDNATYDLTIHAMNDLNNKCRTFENTFYRTYAASI